MRKVLALSLAALLTASCAAPAEPVNSVDVMFLQMLLPHNKQGMRLAALAGGRAKSSEVRTLASAIESTESVEVRSMASWLQEWDQPQTAPSSAHADHGGLPETSEKDIARLSSAKSTFDRDFLTLMIKHQEDAAKMAKLASLNGANPRVLNLARQVERARTAQVAYMGTLLGK